MSGGLAFVYDERNTLPDRHNSEMTTLERLNNEEEVTSLRQLIAAHVGQTGSPHGQKVLADWDISIGKFWKVLQHPPTPETPKVIFTFDKTKVPVAV